MMILFMTAGVVWALWFGMNKYVTAQFGKYETQFVNLFRRNKQSTVLVKKGTSPANSSSSEVSAESK